MGFMKEVYKKWATIALIISLLLIVILFIFTSPRDIGLLGILTVVIVIYALVDSCIYLISAIFRNKKNEGNERRRLLISSALAFVPVFFIIFNSLGAIGLVEIILILLFEAVTIFLIINRT